MQIQQWPDRNPAVVLMTPLSRMAGSILDITAIVAIVGWTIVEMIVIWGLSVFRRQPA